MPLTDVQLNAVVGTIRYVPEGPRRRMAFDAMWPLFHLGDDDDERRAEFDRVCDVLRYVRRCDADRAALASVHMHHLSCRAQAALSSRRRTP